MGCSAFRTIQKVDNVLVFMHYSGMYTLQNRSVTLLSPSLNYTFLNSMNSGYLDVCYAVYNSPQKKYIMGYPSSTSTVCDSALVYDLLVKQFSRWDDIPGSCMINFKFSPTIDTVLMGDPTLGNIYEMFQGYADIAGYNGLTSGGSTTTLVDSTASWTVNEFTDCRVMIGNNLGVYVTAVVASNTSTTLTFTTTLSNAVASGTQYSIGYYTSYWTTKWHDFEANDYTKSYRYFNLFCDVQQWNMLFGYAIDYASVGFQVPFNLGGINLTWGEAGLVWGANSGTWGTYESVFGQGGIASQGRRIQCIIGNNLANQPWRAIKYSFEYKLKRLRTNLFSS